MGGRGTLGAGLLAGAVTGALVLGGLVLLVPGRATPVASSAPAMASPSSAPSPLASAEASSPASPVGSPRASSFPGASASAPSASSSPAATGGAFGVGQPAPSLDLAQLGGGQISLAELRGKPVWVNFMATWCPSCRDELPVMAGFASRYAAGGLVILVIDVREDQATVDAFAKQLGVTLPIGLDIDGRAQAAWKAMALPVHFWVGADGVVRDGALGGIGPDVMAAGLRTILPGVDVTVP